MGAAHPQENNNSANPEREWFGEQRVSASEKTDKVLDVFDSVAKRYDIMNDTMSAGIHRLWKNRLIRHIRPRKNEAFLDLAGGTGDIAFRIYDRTDGQAAITVCDINASMLDVGRNRALDSGRTQNMEWVVGNAESLPFPDAHFDVVTIAFGLRNVTHIDTALRDIHRVLKVGGRFYCLEFSHIDNKLLSGLYRAYSDHIIPKMGELITNDRDSYQYLVESIRKFPTRQALEKRMIEAGFDRAESMVMTQGVVALHTGYKF